MRIGGRRWQRSSFAWAAAAAFLCAGILFLVTDRGARKRQTIWEAGLTATDYGKSSLLSKPIPADRRSSPLLVSYDAPVDQSWVFLECELIDADGGKAAEFFIQLESYYGILDGEKWEKGSGSGSKMVDVTGNGPYRLRVKGSGGFGDAPPSDLGEASGPPVHLRFHTGIPTTRALTWGVVALVLAAVAFLLRALAPPPSSTPDAAPSRPAAKPRFLFLDGLRGVAVTAVLFCHFLVPEISAIAEPLQQALGKPLAAILRHGDLGVEIFFVLSGFVIAFTVVGQNISPGFTGRFVARRAVRLDPPYYIALLVMLTIVAMEHHDGLAGAWRQFGGLDTALVNMFYLQDLLHHPTPLDISWSLCLEIQFYLAIIFLCALAQGLQRIGRDPDPAAAESRQSTWLLVLVLPLMAFSLVCWYPDANRFDFFGTWFRFALGVLACWVYMKRVSPLWLYGALAAIVIPALVIQDLRGIAVAATAASIHCAGRWGRLTTWLSGPVIQFLGRISYSMYLFHLAAGIFVVNLIWSFLEPTPVNALLLVPVGIAGSVLGSLAVYHLFERPSVAISQRIRKQPAAQRKS